MVAVGVLGPSLFLYASLIRVDGIAETVVPLLRIVSRGVPAVMVLK